MTATPVQWNAVLVGAWNRAILTPEWIVKELLDLPAGAKMDVQVAIDRVIPPIVRCDGLVIIPTEDRIDISPEKPDIGDLVKSAEALKRAMQILPRTPLYACGINFRYVVVPVCEELIDVLESTIDNRMLEIMDSTLSRSLSRSVKWNNGSLNLAIAEQESATSALVNLNFELQSRPNQSPNDELSDWLSLCSQMHETAEKTLTDVLRLEIERE